MPRTATPEAASAIEVPHVDDRAREIDESLVQHSRLLHSRADDLRHQAEELDPMLARTFRRRAAELDLASLVAELRSGLPIDEVHTLAA